MRYIHNIPIRYFMAAMAALLFLTFAYETIAEEPLKLYPLSEPIELAPRAKPDVAAMGLMCVAFAEAYITQKAYDGDRVDRQFLNKINKKAGCDYRFSNLERMRKEYADQEAAKKRSRSRKVPVRNPSGGTFRAVAGSRG